ncbi:TRAP-type mannitol/chloroaromatic compound transport system, small permease component [Bosea sp. LC85]|uniref:TRAP transporter small permease subunit n=1 Tax=Bosea sp. LC85 TaxID=1502851 RepID=UPI0004E2D607|nr:TRAP transporter small permease [Bosea sp. LC85]KFC73089.1 TRAP-type mannitol/chloroaromatic compound transport system, small permease component [Bosea sp. LC85]
MPTSRNWSLTGTLQRLSALLANICGYVLLALAVLVTAETLGRKFFNISLQGVDELGGYALAVGSALAFTTALVDRAHIRIELFHVMLPMPLQMALNWFAITSIAAFGGLLAYVCFTILWDSFAYNSTAPTPWATPLIYPQSLWYGGVVIFALVSAVMALHATYLLVTGNGKALNKAYGPKEAAEEVKEELEDLARR